LCDAAEERCFGGFYFLQEAGAAEAAGGFEICRQGDMREVGAPAAAFRLAGHSGAAFCAKLLHEESMARARENVKIADVARGQRDPSLRGLRSG
jgi:ABC-type transporter Mla maintaining outer membrane lipid asymmetry permease subunit MlaE